MIPDAIEYPLTDEVEQLDELVDKLEQNLETKMKMIEKSLPLKTEKKQKLVEKIRAEFEEISSIVSATKELKMLVIDYLVEEQEAIDKKEDYISSLQSDINKAPYKAYLEYKKEFNVLSQDLQKHIQRVTNIVSKEGVNLNLLESEEKAPTKLHSHILMNNFGQFKQESSDKGGLKEPEKQEPTSKIESGPKK